MAGTNRRPVFWVALLCLCAVGVEGGAYLVEWTSGRVFAEPIRRRSSILREQSERIDEVLAANGSERLLLDSVLGWRYRSGFASATDHLNAAGLRATREYAPTAARGTLRVAAFGDSFVYGNEVADADAWCALLEAGGDSIEVLNYGVGGYGLDQAFLRFEQEGMALQPDAVLIGFTPDDLRRVVNVYRRFLSSLEWPLTKPRFLMRDDGSAVLVPNPLPNPADYARLKERPTSIRELGAHDQWYSPTVYENPLYDWSATLRVGHGVWQRLARRYIDADRLMRGEVFNRGSSALAVQLAILRMFADSVRERGLPAVVVMLPDRGSVDQARAGRPTSYAPMLDSLVGSGITVWDGVEAFRVGPARVPELFASGGHYSPAGNHVLADWLRPLLGGLGAGRRVEP